MIKLEKNQVTCSSETFNIRKYVNSMIVLCEVTYMSIWNTKPHFQNPKEIIQIKMFKIFDNVDCSEVGKNWKIYLV